MKRQLLVHIDQDFVGTLFENQGIWSFHYDEHWVEAGFDLSPGLVRTRDEIVDSGSVRPVQWFFDNLLPEDAARVQIVAMEAAGTQQTFNVELDAWALLTRFGAETAGALTLQPPGAAEPEEGQRPLPDEELEARIRAMPRQPLMAKAPKKMSLAGAQQKLPVILGAGGELSEPTGARASTHILKPNVLTEHYPCSAVNEWFCARLAHELGLEVPQVWLKYVPSSVYIIERFDRKRTDGGIQRLHALDALQLLSLAAGAKYARSGVKALLDIIDKCRVKATTRIALFRWTLFNILIGNSDAHLKNISLLSNTDGYFLAPHYDLLSTAAWATHDLAGQGEAVWPAVEMSFPIGQAGRYDQLTKAGVVAFGEQLGLRAATINREFDRLVGRIQGAADRIYDEYAGRGDVPAPLRAAELRMLRSIRHLPINDMVALLSRKSDT